MSYWYLQFSKKMNEKIRHYYYGTSNWIVFVRFLGELKTPKRHFEINWPLELNRKTKMTCVIEKPFANMHSEIKTHTHRMGKCKSWNWAFNYTLFWKSKISALKSVFLFKLRINFLFNPNNYNPFLLAIPDYPIEI